jgi:hypothetical protein
VSPQELVQILSVDSKRKFTIGTRSDVLELLLWLLTSLQKGLDGNNHSNNKKGKLEQPSVLYEPFQVRVCPIKILNIDREAGIS